jgi:hypothetical protein
MGNPPFIGAKIQSTAQREQVRRVDSRKVGWDSWFVNKNRHVGRCCAAFIVAREEENPIGSRHLRQRDLSLSVAQIGNAVVREFRRAFSIAALFAVVAFAGQKPFRFNRSLARNLNRNRNFRARSEFFARYCNRRNYGARVLRRASRPQFRERILRVDTSAALQKQAELKCVGAETMRPNAQNPIPVSALKLHCFLHASQLNWRFPRSLRAFPVAVWPPFGHQARPIEFPFGETGRQGRKRRVSVDADDVHIGA